MMSNSALVNYTLISPNSTNPRNTAIKKITIHHMAGNLTVESCGAVFAPSSRQASSNYGIGTDGRVGMYVEEKNRSWCSSSAANDHQAVTIEVANSTTSSDWPVSNAALAKLIDLCTDICQRNDIEKLNFTGDATGNLTQHNYFAATACPGPYLKSKFQYIADEVNKRLGATDSGANTDASTGTDYTKGTVVKFKGGPHFKSSSATTASGTPIAGPAEVTATAPGAAHPYHLVHADSGSTVYGWVDAANIEGAVTNNGLEAPYLVRVTATSLNIRKGPGTGYGTNGSITDKGIYTIVEESSGAGATLWGRLKSGAGWVSLDYTNKI